MAVVPRDHDRPGCGARRVARFPGSRRLYGVPRWKCAGEGYQRPSWGRSWGTERACRGGSRWNYGGAQSHRLWDEGGNQSRKVGRSGMLRSSGSGMSHGVGRSRLVDRESGEEGCMAAFGRGDGGDG